MKGPWGGGGGGCHGGAEMRLLSVFCLDSRATAESEGDEHRDLKKGFSVKGSECKNIKTK